MTFESTYKLDRVTSAIEHKYIQALDIYSKCTHPSLRTETTSISYWLEHYNKRFEDEFHVLAFSNNSKVIGYTQLTYFHLEKIVVIDYITIDEKFRKNNTFFEFCDHINEYIETEFRDCYLTVVELGTIENPSRQSDDFEKMRRLIGMQGFYELEVDYWQLELSEKNHESYMKSHLFINPKPVNNLLRKNTVVDILQVLYIKHYARWFEVYGKEKHQKYTDKAEALLGDAVSKLKDSVAFKSDATFLHEQELGSSATAIQVHSINASLRVLATLLFIACTIGFFIKYINIDIEKFYELLSIVFLVFLGILSIFMPKVLNVLNSFMLAIAKIYRGK
ncbi:hypothetical protein ACFFK7_18320 [Pseudoalteromonas xiamenensis]|uniref:hypothetical protein n=1 Tax=Pseudoalteromonas xiamenensis TaxID=882626 RepID=UPI0035E5A838